MADNPADSKTSQDGSGPDSSVTEHLRAEEADLSRRKDPSDGSPQLAGGNGAAASNEQPESTAQNPPCHEDSIASDPASPCAGGPSGFLALFGADRVLENIPPNDPRISADPLWAQEASFAARNSRLVGIVCGPLANQHLVAVVFPDPTSFELFFRMNPDHPFPTIQYGSGVRVCFLFVEGPVPTNLRTKPLTWLAGGVVPVGADLPDTVEAGLVMPRIKFEAIAWEPEVREAFEARKIQQQYGSPFIRVKKREFNFNPRFLAEHMLKDYELAYNRNEETFVCYDRVFEDWQKLTAKEVANMVADRLIQLAEEVPDHIHPADVGEATVKRVLWLMQHLGAARCLTHQEVCDRYFNEVWESSPAASLTQEEAYQGLETFCKTRKLSLPSRAFFDRTATRRFGETVHYLGPKANLRGRVGWRLRHEVIAGVASPSGGGETASDKA